jgi:hypothetical protein
MTDQRAVVAQLAKTILQDPILLDRLCDRIYDLLTTETRLQKERNPRRF